MKASSWAKYSCVVKILFPIWNYIKATHPFQKQILVGQSPGPQAFNPPEMLPRVLDSPSENTKEFGFLEVQTFICLLKPDIFKAAK